MSLGCVQFAEAWSFFKLLDLDGSGDVEAEDATAWEMRCLP